MPSPVERTREEVPTSKVKKAEETGMSNTTIALICGGALIVAGVAARFYFTR